MNVDDIYQRFFNGQCEKRFGNGFHEGVVTGLEFDGFLFYWQLHVVALCDKLWVRYNQATQLDRDCWCFYPLLQSVDGRTITYSIAFAYEPTE